MNIAMFIDYDNLLERQKSAGILDVTTSALVRTVTSPDDERESSSCEVRVYGGWYEGDAMTTLAQIVSAEVQRDFPALIRVGTKSGGRHTINAVAELAFSLLEEPAYHLFSTYRTKAMPRNLKVQQPAAVGCTQPTCPLSVTKQLLKSGKCPDVNCSVAATDLVYRHEQKIVDAMLTCDMIFCADRSYDHAILVSSDDDFLPSIRTVLLRGTPVTRVYPKPGAVPVVFPPFGAALNTIDL